MPQVYRLKHTFTSGELSPRFGARLDFDRQKNGCKKLHNMTCQAQGPATRRVGTKFVYDLNRLSINTIKGRVREIPFIFSETQAYSLIFFEADSGEIYMVIGYDDTLVASTGMISDYDKEVTEDYAGSGNDHTFTFTANDTYVGETITLIETDGTEHEIDSADYVTTVDEAMGEVVINITDTQVAEQIRILMELQTAAIPVGDIIALDLPVGFNIEEFDYTQSLDEIYIAQPNMQPIVIIRRSIENWAWASISFSCYPQEWPMLPDQTPDYDATSGWPETVTFHQQRLIWGGNDARPQSVWTSAAGDYLNMGDFDGGGCDGVNDADGLSFRLDSGTMNKIKWLLSSKILAIGTVGNEWTVQGNMQSAMAPQSILAQRQTNMGSEKVKPLMVGLSTLFIERHGRTINEFKYEYTTDSYETSDRSILATHFTDYYSIVDWTFQQMPDQVIWMIREDGVMLGCTYQREHKVVGWHLHDTQGEFKAVTCIPGPRRSDEVWIIVKRIIEGNVHFYVERMEDEFTGTTVMEGRFLDSHILISPTSEIITGLEHLNGFEVDIIADGTVHPSRTVVGGSITLNYDGYFEVLIGLGYVSEVRPYLPDLRLQDGTAHGRSQRIVNVSLDLYKTLGGYIGRVDSEDGESEEEIPFRRPENLMGNALPLFSGIYKYAYAEGYDTNADYFIRQKQPLPMTVLGVVDYVEVN